MSKNSTYPVYGISADWEKYMIPDDDAFPWAKSYKKKETEECQHEWKETRLVVSSVYDCKLCGKKKEEVEK